MARSNLLRRSGARDGGELSPWTDDPLARFRRDFDQLMDRFFGDAPQLSTWGVDVEDRDQELVVHAEAPGFEPGDFDVQVQDHFLTLRAERKEEKEEEGRSYFRRGMIHERIPLPSGVETDKVEARYRNGILEIHVPKGEEAKGKRIAVKSE